MTTRDQAYALLLLFAISCLNCATIPGAGDSLPSSRPVCLSRAEWARIRKAQKRCVQKIKDQREDCATKIDKIEAGQRAALRLRAIDLRQCREERDRSLQLSRKKCAPCRATVWPIVVGVLGGVVVGVGVGVIAGIVVVGD